MKLKITRSTPYIEELNTLAQIEDSEARIKAVHGSEIFTLMQGVTELDASNLRGRNIREEEGLTTGGMKLLLDLAAGAPRLTKIDLSGNRVGQKGVMEAVENLATSPTLLSINLSNNGLMERAVPIMKAFAKSNITDLDISFNNLTDFPEGIAEAISGLNNLSSFNISENGLGRSMIEIAKACAQLPGLSTLNISQNELGEHGVDVAKALAKSTSLVALDASSNELRQSGPDFAKALAQSNLSAIDVRDNDLGHYGIGVAEALAESCRLSILDIRDNGSENNISAIVEPLMQSPVATIITGQDNNPQDTAKHVDARNTEILEILEAFFVLAGVGASHGDNYGTVGDLLGKVAEDTDSVVPVDLCV